MNYFADTPYRRYPEIREAVQKGEVTLTYNRATGYRLACQVRKSFALTFLYIPALTAVVIYIMCLYLPIPKTAILFSLAGIVLYPFVPFISRIMVFAGVILIVLSLGVLRESMWLLAAGVGLIVIRFTYGLWWLFISRVADRSLMNSEALFETEWKQKNIALEGSDDGSYYMFGKTRPEKQKKDKKDKKEDKSEADKE
jgi:hypothetical protein